MEIRKHIACGHLLPFVPVQSEIPWSDRRQTLQTDSNLIVYDKQNRMKLQKKGGVTPPFFMFTASAVY